MKQLRRNILEDDMVKGKIRTASIKELRYLWEWSLKIDYI